MAAITLRNVAELADVSIGTASQALNNHPSVSPETRARVVDAAMTLGYKFKVGQPGSQASSEQLSVVGMLVKHDVGTPAMLNPFHMAIQAGIEAECRGRQIGLMLSAVEVDASNRPLAWPAMISNRQIEGLILLGTFLDNTTNLLRRVFEGPIVLIDSYAPRLPFDSIVTDNLGGAQQAIDHLVGLGHRHIGLVGANPASPPSILERRAGYERALRSHGIEELYIEDSMLSQPDGYEATRRLLARAPQVSAIFACNDITAFGVLDAARELGRNVPDDLSIIGFDNIESAKDQRPALTTIQVFKGWMGALGLRRLLERAEAPDLPKTTTTLATQLIERVSTQSVQQA
jgi:LacI family transcriptional regulator